MLSFLTLRENKIKEMPHIFRIKTSYDRNMFHAAMLKNEIQSITHAKTTTFFEYFAYVRD